MRKYIDVGNKVLILSTGQLALTRYIGAKGIVKAIHLEYVPASALVAFSDWVEATFYLRDLELMPPRESAFQYDEEVQIRVGYKRTRHHICDSDLVGKTGIVRGFDHRDGTYYVDCATDATTFIL